MSSDDPSTNQTGVHSTFSSESGDSFSQNQGSVPGGAPGGVSKGLGGSGGGVPSQGGSLNSQLAKGTPPSLSSNRLVSLVRQATPPGTNDTSSDPIEWSQTFFPQYLPYKIKKFKFIFNIFFQLLIMPYQIVLPQNPKVAQFSYPQIPNSIFLIF